MAPRVLPRRSPHRPGPVRMALALGALLALGAPQAQGLGIVVALFPQKDLKGDATWAVPETEPSASCTALPSGPSAASLKVWWSSSDGKAQCPALAFHATPNCKGPSVTIPQPPPPSGGAQWVTIDNDLAAGQLADVIKAQALSCATAPAEVPSGTPGSGVVSVATGADAWLAALNSARSQGNPLANPLTWDAQLESSAQNWTNSLSSSQCGAAQVVLAKIPDSGVSESDVWISFSTKESDAVMAWAPDPADSANPRTARITDSKSKTVGCAKTVCLSGAFFTCLFAPMTF